MTTKSKTASPKDYRLLAQESKFSNDAPTRHHLDRRAAKLADEDPDADDDELLNPKGAPKVGQRLLGMHVAEKTSSDAPTKFHLDRRAAKLADEDADADDDELLSTREVAHWFCTSTQWLEIGRTRGYGPRFVRIGVRSIKYRR